ncbi:RagB/SusD family nutrient uptake outer membrane protein [Chitinophaga sp. RCC_12]|uniref:RagB/SusD family nutrient uptake outer membrane protein n=1 Tax=Chitinophaga sp. RCC_12 TaxID=3239226 RepID=UPI003524FD26
MKTKLNYYSLLILHLVLISSACKKQNDWLDVKRSKSDVRPETLKDFQALMDNYVVMNNSAPTIGLLGTDNLVIPDENLGSLSQIEQNAYVWAKDIWIINQSYDWSLPYKTIEYANVALDGIIKTDRTDASYNNVLGQAYFHRALALYNLAQLFCKPYERQTASHDPAIPIRLSSDVNILYPRSTVENLFEQLIHDAGLAAALLPEFQKTNFRPNNRAAFGLLAKIYLNMGNYGQAIAFADSALNKNNKLLDYNSDLVSLDQTYRFPVFGRGNPEVLFYCQGGYPSTWPSTYSFQYIPKELYQSYQQDDLRRQYFFEDNEGADKLKYRGSYSGGDNNFCGIANNELILIRSEAYARTAKISEAMKDLNYLLVNRYKTGTFTPVIANNPDSVLTLILKERRKELPLTANIRWEDLRRLNTENQFAITIERKVNGKTYRLLPTSLNYILPIPDEEIQLSGLEQNPRN